jgi:hypothetical protein
VTPYGLVDGINILEDPALSIFGHEAYIKYGGKNGLKKGEHCEE